MLKITKATEPLNITTIVTCIYGAPGVGKTSLASSANAPLLLDFDAGSHRSAFRKDVVQVAAWNDIQGLTREDLAPYKTIIIDTIGRALDLLSADIINGNSKMGRNGSLTLQGYGELKGRFTQWLKYLRSFGLDIVIIAHSAETQQGDVTVDRIDAQGSSKNEVYKSADLMGRLSFENGRRVLNFNPTDTAFGKNPGNIAPGAVPDLATSPDALGSIIGDVKNSLNKMDAKNSEARDLIEQWRVCLENCKTVDDFNNWLPKAKETGNKSISAMIAAAAKKAGFKFNKPEGKFEVVA